MGFRGERFLSSFQLSLIESMGVNKTSFALSRENETQLVSLCLYVCEHTHTWACQAVFLHLGNFWQSVCMCVCVPELRERSIWLLSVWVCGGVWLCLWLCYWCFTKSIANRWSQTVQWFPLPTKRHMQTHTLSSDKQLQYVLLQYKNISDQGFSSIKDYTK